MINNMKEHRQKRGIKWQSHIWNIYNASEYCHLVEMAIKQWGRCCVYRRGCSAKFNETINQANYTLPSSERTGQEYGYQVISLKDPEGGQCGYEWEPVLKKGDYSNDDRRKEADDNKQRFVDFDTVYFS